jgi:catechol 2,3-dioxygenase-like lactoylglutathione lyase family enzyme
VSAQVHHYGIAVADLDESLRFYRDGLGLQVILDEHFERDWLRLLGSPSTRVHIVVLAPPEDPTACAVELLAFEDDVARPRPPGPPIGVSHVSMTFDGDATLQRLAELGYSDIEEDSNDVDGVTIRLVFIRDPDGVIVELGCPMTPAQGIE